MALTASHVKWKAVGTQRKLCKDSREPTLSAPSRRRGSRRGRRLRAIRLVRRLKVSGAKTPDGVEHTVHHTSAQRISWCRHGEFRLPRVGRRIVRLDGTE